MHPQFMAYFGQTGKLSLLQMRTCKEARISSYYNSVREKEMMPRLVRLCDYFLTEAVVDRKSVV